MKRLETSDPIAEAAAEPVKDVDKMQPILTRGDKFLLRAIEKDCDALLKKDCSRANRLQELYNEAEKYNKEFPNIEANWHGIMVRCKAAEAILAAPTFKLAPSAIIAIDAIISKPDKSLGQHSSRRNKKSADDTCLFLRVATFTDDGKVLQKFHIQRDTGRGYKKKMVTDIDGAFILTSQCSKKVFRTVGVIDPKRRVCTIKVDKDGATKFQRAMEELSQDPENFLATVGKKLGECCRCGRPLSDEQSKKRGFGPICYKTIGKLNGLIALCQRDEALHNAAEEPPKKCARTEITRDDASATDIEAELDDKIN
jgi:hypothetical protein